MPRVHLPDGRVVNFPDGMSEQDITKAMGEIQAPKAEERSVGGFLGNVASSGGKFVADTVKGIPGLAKIAGQAVVSTFNPEYGRMMVDQVARSLPDAASALGSAAKARYGGIDQIKNTLYNDPVGVASDISTILMPAKAGLKAGGFSKLADVAGKAERLTNPMTAIGGAAKAVAQPVARGIVRGTLRPSQAVRDDFGGSKGVADAVLKDRVYSEASAVRKLDRSVAQADDMITNAQAAGVPGVPRAAVARSVLGTPKDTAKLRTRLGKPDQTADLTDEAKAIFKNNPSEIPLTDAQTMKREAQTLAYEAGADNKSVQKAAEIEKAKALRAGIEQRVPQVGPVNERSQRLLGSKLAFGAAEDRPRALTNFLSILGGGAGFAGGGPFGAVAIPALMKAADSPRMGAMAGIGINELGRGLGSNVTAKSALLARLLEQIPEE